MKLAWLVPSLLLLASILAGCIQPADIDTASTIPTEAEAAATWAKPLPDVIAGIKHLAPSDVPSGAGIWLHGDFAYVSGLATGLHIVDLSDPTAPLVVGGIEGEFFTRDVDFYTTADDRLIAVAAGEGGGMHFIDVTNPTAPEVLATLKLDGSTHNLAVLPGTSFVYNAASDGLGGKMELVDGSNPAAPVKVAEFGDAGCHDITFYHGDEKSRLYCAGIDETQIWDNADPLTPVKIAKVNNVFVERSAGLHHLAMVNEDATVLIIGDEFTGGLGPGCGATAEGKSTPIGALWFYDISGDNEKAPKELGSFAPQVPAINYVMGAVANPDAFGTAFGMSCTSHFGTLIPGHEMLAMAWYRAGVVLVDFSNPASPVQVDQWNMGTNTWDVQYHNGYLFTGDMKRGLDVLTFE